MSHSRGGRGPPQRSADRPAPNGGPVLDRETIRLLQEEDEEEALRRAIEESCREHPLYEGYNHSEFFPDAPVAAPEVLAPPANEEDEDEQLRRAIEESLREEEEQKRRKEALELDEAARDIQRLIAQMDADEQASRVDSGATAGTAVSIEHAPNSTNEHNSSGRVVAEVISSSIAMINSIDPTPHEVIDDAAPAQDIEIVEEIPLVNQECAITTQEVPSIEQADLPHVVDIAVLDAVNEIVNKENFQVQSEEILVEEEISLEISADHDNIVPDEVVAASDETSPPEVELVCEEGGAVESVVEEHEIPVEEEISPPLPVPDAAETTSLPVMEDGETVVSDGEDVFEDEWELVPGAGQLDGSILLEEYHSDSDDDGCIAEPDAVFRSSPMRSVPSTGLFEQVSEVEEGLTSSEIPDTIQAIEDLEDDYDPVLAHAQELLERSGYIAIERQLQEESDEFIESLLREHLQDMDMQASLHSLGAKSSESVEEVVSDEEFMDAMSEVDTEEQTEVFLSAHSTPPPEEVHQQEVESIPPVPEVKPPAAPPVHNENHLSISQLKALPLDANALRCPPDVFALLKRGKFQFEREHGVKLTFSNATECVVTLHHSDPDVSDIGMSELQSIIRDSDAFEQQLLVLNNEHTHIFVDNSNIFIGAQVVGIDKSTRKFIYDHSVRLNHKALHRVVNNERNCQRRFVVGSETPSSSASAGGKQSSDNAWSKHWQKAGYKVYLHPLNADGKESVVDSSLIAEITIHLGNIERQRRVSASVSSSMDTLVLLTGDGNDNQGNASLFATVQHALDLGWNVELWCWRLSASKNYRRLADQYASSGRFVLRFLDNYRDEIAFKQVRKNRNNH